MPEIVVEEKIDFAPIGNLVIGTRGLTPLSGVKGRIKILRHLSADTFDVYFEHLDAKHSLFPYVNIATNNKLQKTFETAYILASAPKDNGFMRVHRSVLGDAKFSDLSKITLGYSLKSDLEQVSGNEISRITTLPFVHSIQKTISGNFGSVIHLKTIKSVTIEKITKYSTSVPNKADKEFKRTIRYNNIYIVPTQPKRIGGNKTLFKIYMDNDMDEDFNAQPTIIGDNRIISKKMKSTSFGATGVETEVFSDSTDEYTPVGKTTKVKQVARVDLMRRSHYDFDKKKTVLGNSWDSVDGEIIPYSLKGNYLRELEISFNDSFKDVKLNFVKRFNKPILDRSEGDVQLKIENDFKPSEAMNRIFKSKMHKLNSDKIRQIKNNDFSLIGLERL